MKPSDNSSFQIATEDEFGWLMTYADLMTLLLVFFVMLFTLESMGKENYRSTVESIVTELKKDTPQAKIMEMMEIPESPDTKITLEDLTGLRSKEKSIVKEINKYISAQKITKKVRARILDGKIVVTVTGKTLFDSGSAALKLGGASTLDKIVQVAYDYPNYAVNIKGHTDDIPIATAAYPSNWELSAVRATTVLKHLIKMGVSPNRLTATGYGDIVPMVPNNSKKNRAINRRVEFVLEKKESP